MKESLTQQLETQGGLAISRRLSRRRFERGADSSARLVLLLPTILIVLFLSIFPLVVSLFLSFARVNFARGGVDISFVGFSNYQKLLFGSQQRHLIGKLGEMSPLGWFVFLLVTGALLYWFYIEVRDSKMKI